MCAPLRGAKRQKRQKDVPPRSFLSRCPRRGQRQGAEISPGAAVTDQWRRRGEISPGEPEKYFCLYSD